MGKVSEARIREHRCKFITVEFDAGYAEYCETCGNKPPKIMKCANCKFWREPFDTADGPKAHCKKDPPIAVVTSCQSLAGGDGVYDEVAWTQPLTKASDYCFWYSEKS